MTSTSSPTDQAKEKPQELPSAVEFEPPLACVRRILKNSLPSSTNVGKDASAAFARASGIFIIYLTACANDFAREHKRQTITANDVLAAIKELDFDEFTPDMLKFLQNYRSMEKSKKDAKAKAIVAKKKEDDNDDEEEEEDESKATATKPGEEDQGEEDDDGDNDHDDTVHQDAEDESERAGKRQREDDISAGEEASPRETKRLKTGEEDEKEEEATATETIKEST